MKIVYEAKCVENGEFFVTTFKTKETDPKKLMRIGKELAIGWGGECYEVTKAEDQARYSDIWDADDEN